VILCKKGKADEALQKLRKIMSKLKLTVGMGDASEVVREVSVNDFRVATEQQLFHLDHRLLGIAPGTVRVAILCRKPDEVEHCY
jgi:hypothetical protein